MPQAINGITVIATKVASGVQLIFQNAVGGIIFIAVIPTADFSAFNTTVNGGSVGTALTKVYAQDQNKGDYPQHYNHGEGN